MGFVDIERKEDRKTLFHPKLNPGPNERRFDTIDVLPKISSKYRKNDRGFELGKMSNRDPNFMISALHGSMLSNEEKGYK